LELLDYVKILRKRGWIILLVAFITAASAFVFSKLQMPEYKGGVRLQFQPARADWGLTGAAKTLLPSYRNIILSYAAAQKVIDRLQLDMSPDRLLSKVTTSADEADFTIRIEARDHDGEIAQQIAYTFAQVFIEDRAEWNQRQDKRDRVEVYMLDRPRYSLYRPKTKINTLAGGLFGAIVGALIMLFLEWLERDILRTSDDVERYVGLPLLGAIPVEVGASPIRRSIPWPKLDVGKALWFGSGFVMGGIIATLALWALRTL